MSKQTVLTWGVVVVLLAVPALAESDSDMLERVLPGVVTVAGYKAKSAPVRDNRGQLKRLPLQRTRALDPYEKVLDLSGAVQFGSGFIIERGGKKYVVTNAHVVAVATDDPDALAVFTADQKRHNMKVVGVDWFYDIAVLAFTDDGPGSDAAVMSFRKAEARIGEKVWALGNPLGRYPFSVSNGIVGGKNRKGSMLPFGYLQTTATVIWGNSGGPVVDGDGKVVGVNTRIEIVERGGQAFVQPQLNFALAANITQRVVEEFLTKGRVTRPYFGLAVVQDYALKQTPRGMDVDPTTAGVPAIAAVVSGSPADKALGDKTGAKVLAVNGKAVRTVEEVLTALENAKPNEPVSLEIQTGKGKETVKIVPTEMNDKGLGDLAALVFKRVGYNVVEENRGLSIRRAGRAVTDPEEREGPPDREGPAVRPGPRLGPGPGPGPQKMDPPVPYGPGRGPQGPNPYMQFDYNNRREGFRPIQRTPQSLAIVAVGLVDNNGDGMLWRVGTLGELGIACRLTALSGQLHVAYVNDDGSCSILQCRLSESQNVLSKLLLY